MLTALLGWTCGDALAYRPFDSTDAAIAEPGEFELELGPVESLRQGSQRSLGRES